MTDPGPQPSPNEAEAEEREIMRAVVRGLMDLDEGRESDLAEVRARLGLG